MQWAKQKQSGFTIVELLIVVVVIAILAAITIVSYNGIRQSAQNSQQVAALNTYVKALLAYSSENNQYPTTSSACFDGTTTCWSGTISPAGSAALVAGISTYLNGSFPDLPFDTVITTGTAGSFTGTYIAFNVNNTGSCPGVGGTTYINTSTSGNLRLCRVGLPNPS